jgi:uncharacterized membrane protein (DUF485 family)
MQHVKLVAKTTISPRGRGNFPDLVRLAQMPGQRQVSARSAVGKNCPLASLWSQFTRRHFMQHDLIQRVVNNPKYQELKRKRSSFGWTLTWAMMIVYYGFILLVAFNKEFLSQKLGAGVMTIGVPIGFGVIVFTVIITTIYVRRANSEYDDLTAAITKAVLK